MTMQMEPKTISKKQANNVKKDKEKKQSGPKRIQVANK
jgi:hypothetical protein